MADDGVGASQDRVRDWRDLGGRIASGLVYVLVLGLLFWTLQRAARGDLVRATEQLGSALERVGELNESVGAWLEREDACAARRADLLRRVEALEAALGAGGARRLPSK